MRRTAEARKAWFIVGAAAKTRTPSSAEFDGGSCGRRRRKIERRSRGRLLGRASRRRLCGCRAAAGALEAVAAAKLLGELVHPACGVDELLLSGEERMTGRADV